MNIDNINFKGYDARPIKSVLMRDIGVGESYKGLIKELSSMGDKVGFDVFIQNREKIMKSNEYRLNPEKIFPNEYWYPWSQDNITFTPNGKVLGTNLLSSFNEVVADYFKKPLNQLKEHIQGGNFFFIKDGNKEKVLVGEKELNTHSEEDLKEYFETDEVLVLPQPDFHLDLGIRPLENKVVLVNDNNLLIENITKAIMNCKKYLKSNCNDKEIFDVMDMLFQMQQVAIKGQESNKYPNTDKIVAELKRHGFFPKRVAGSFIRPKFVLDMCDENHYMANFMNAIVHKNDNGDLIYLTNKSYLDNMAGINKDIEQKIGFSFEKMFKDNIRDYVNADNVYFISAEGYLPYILEHCQGGLHCICAEECK